MFACFYVFNYCLTFSILHLHHFTVYFHNNNNIISLEHISRYPKCKVTYVKFGHFQMSKQKIVFMI